MYFCLFICSIVNAFAVISCTPPPKMFLKKKMFLCTFILKAIKYVYLYKKSVLYVTCPVIFLFIDESCMQLTFKKVY